MHKNKKKKPIIIDPCAIKQTEGEFISKPMIFLFNTAEHFKELALESRENWENTDPVDQKSWREERMYAGSAFLHYSLYCEALVNNVWVDFKKREVKDLPTELTKNLQKGVKDDNLPFKDRLFLTPFLCLEKPDYNYKYFRKGSNNFHKIIELFQIRDSYVHAKPTGRKMKITIRSNRLHHIDDSNPLNIWQRTQICKDITLVSVHELQTVKDSTDWLFSSLNNFLGNALDNKKWKEEEIIKMKEGTLYTSHKIN